MPRRVAINRAGVKRIRDAWNLRSPAKRDVDFHRKWAKKHKVSTETIRNVVLRNGVYR